MRVLELFAGIGGCAAACAGQVEIVAAVDINARALEIYGHNFPHPTYQLTIESLPYEWLARWEADLWWLSPPCQPFTRRGNQRDIDDPRALALLTLIDRIEEIRPLYVALENVPEFQTSRARRLLLEALHRSGYQFRERLLCPTEMQIHNRRQRYYLVASRVAKPLNSWPPLVRRERRVHDIVEPAIDPSLYITDRLYNAYCSAMHVVEARDADCIASCFTAAYGRSHIRSGSFLRTVQGVRRFSPREIARLLGFPNTFNFSVGESHEVQWRLVGNSLSVDAVREVLRDIVEF